MALSNVVLLSQIAGYIVALILSLCVIVPMSLHQDDFRLVIVCLYWMRFYNFFLMNFRGHCLLFSSGVWRESDGQFIVDWASQGYCNYPIFIGVIMFLVSAIQLYRQLNDVCM